jgi:hypothetical protein
MNQRRFAPARMAGRRRTPICATTRTYRWLRAGFEASANSIDSDLRDYENVPLGEDVNAYFEREVRPHVPDAWINTEVKDEKDGQVGKVGYEIPLTRHFYVYQPPRPLAEIKADIAAIEKDIVRMLREVVG